jgi:hypothetical protein
MSTTIHERPRGGLGPWRAVALLWISGLGAAACAVSQESPPPATATVAPLGRVGARVVSGAGGVEAIAGALARIGVRCQAVSAWTAACNAQGGDEWPTFSYYQVAAAPTRIVFVVQYRARGSDCRDFNHAPAVEGFHFDGLGSAVCAEVHGVPSVLLKWPVAIPAEGIDVEDAARSAALWLRSIRKIIEDAHLNAFLDGPPLPFP